jgi:hypothetical protein
MLGGKIGGIPILWIMMAASRRKGRTMVKPENLGLGDFIIDPLSQQWCRVIRVEHVWVDVESFDDWLTRALTSYEQNRPLHKYREEYEKDLEHIRKLLDAKGRPHYIHYSMAKEFWVTHVLKLQFADNKTIGRDVNEDDGFTCIRAPEIFNFNFKELENLAGNSARTLEGGKDVA